MPEYADPSPYAPPPIIEGDEPLALELANVPRVPWAVTLGYALVATLLTIVIPFRGMLVGLNDSGPFDDGSFYLAVLAAPPIAIAGFVLLCLFVMGSGGLLPSRSLAWRTVMVLLVPLAAMLVFIPTCIGSTMFTMPFLAGSIGPVAMALPIFIAFWITLAFVELRLRRRLSIRDPN